VPDALTAGPVSAYIGFDPTGSSLHVGSLVPIMVLVHLQRHGHRPVALVGGGTGMIGDPSGKASERQLLTAEQVAENARGIHDQLERFLTFEGPSAARMRDNAAWLTPLHLVDFLRDVGKHFTVNYMLQKESVRSRMDAGISFTEFTYMLLQAYDFLELRRRDGVTLQLGGSDQWGNITAGIELIRRVDGADAHALTMPLVTTSSGAKFGKTEAGAVWLDEDRTSPYAFYQFWLGTEDADVGRYLRYYTLLARDEIESLDAETASAPERRAAQQALARDVTRRVHGAAALAAPSRCRVLLRRPRGDGVERRRVRRAARGGAVRRSDARYPGERDGSGTVRRAQAARRVGARRIERRGEAAARAGGRVGEQTQAGEHRPAHRRGRRAAPRRARRGGQGEARLRAAPRAGLSRRHGSPAARRWAARSGSRRPYAER
jgi:tyrosyl-tRNA synthetase